MHLSSIPRIIHVHDRNMNYYMKNNNTQYKNKYKNTYSSKQNEKKNNGNDAYSQRIHGPEWIFAFPWIVDNRFPKIASSTVNANDRTSSFELLLLQSSPVVEISSPFLSPNEKWYFFLPQIN